MSDPIHECIVELDGLLASKRLGVEAHYRMLAVVAKLRHASQDRDPRGSSSSPAEEAPVHAPLPSPGVTLRHISALWQVEGELRGASGLIFRTGSATLIEDVGGLFDLLTTNADRLEGVLNEVSGGHDRTNNNPRE